MYGHTEPVHFSVSSRDFFKTFSTISESTIVTLEVGSSQRDVLIKDYDEDITTGTIVHLDFFEVEKGKKLRTHVAIELTGSPVGVRLGGILDNNLHQVEVECLPKDIPEKFVIDVSGLDRDESIHVSDLALPEGVRVLTAPEQTIASIVMPRAEVESDDEAGDGEGAGEASAE
ncbi:ribosomal 5S rRNA E-loop-binding protein [Alkalispirochaeta sphaeroplastigenens]|uniref:50S ribosomal protein L25 n=1 Tax=Alkalispirochaeta sphaeroplastigenens TaxID=1187066 RepID=A0A2S4K1M8_9SPIO|nr:ribosomal 5S rRNA E-loop-binding protein [Alkalispirochaeta sphaeroplastigenens]